MQTTRKTRTVWAAVLALTLLLSQAGLAAPARAEEPEHYGLWVGGDEVMSDRLSGGGDGTWSYDAGTNTLTLADYIYSGTGHENAAIYYIGPDTLTLRLVGESILEQEAEGEVIPEMSRCVYTAGDLVIQSDEDDSRLWADVSEADAQVSSIGIDCGSLTVTGGSLLSIAGNAEQSSIGIRCRGNIDITGGSILGIGNKAGSKSCGIECGDFTVRVDRTDASFTTVDATSGGVTGPEGYTCGIDCNDFTVRGGTVNSLAFGSAAGEDGCSWGVYCGKLVLCGGAELVSLSGAASYSSIAVECDSLTLYEKSVLYAENSVNPASGDPEPLFCAGVSCDSVEITDDDPNEGEPTNIVAKSDKAYIASYGIDCKTLSVSNASIEAFADSSGGSFGIGCFDGAAGLKAKLVGTYTNVVGRISSDHGVGIEIREFDEPDSRLGVFLGEDASDPMTAAEYLAYLDTDRMTPCIRIAEKHEDPEPEYYYYNDRRPAEPGETRFDKVDTGEGGSLAEFKAAGTYTEGMFTDAAPGKWFAENLKAAVEYGILEGMGDGTFGVGRPLKVSETLAIVCRLHNIFYGGSGKFDQSKDAEWYTVYEDYAVKYGIIEQGQFDLTEPATRAQFAGIIAAALPDSAFAPINTVTALPDVASDDPRLPAILKLYNAGILTGVDGSGRFDPDAVIPREQAAAIVTRAVDPALRKVLPPGV